MSNFTYNALTSLKSGDVPAGVGQSVSGTGTKEEYFNQPVPSGLFDLAPILAQITTPCWLQIIADKPFAMKFDAGSDTVMKFSNVMFRAESGAIALQLDFAIGASLKILAVQ